MGHDVLPIGNHTLETIDIYSLAADLSKRMKCVIVYGYYDYKKTQPYIEYGREGTGAKIYFLEYDYHLNRQKQPDRYKNITSYTLNCLECLEENATRSIQIFKDSFITPEYFNSRWWNFCSNFMEKDIDWEELERFRKNVRNQVEDFGGDYAIYIDDQSDSSYLLDSPLEQQSIDSLLHKMKNDISILDITKWIYSCKPVLKDHPIAFIDDFKSL